MRSQLPSGLPVTHRCLLTGSATATSPICTPTGMMAVIGLFRLLNWWNDTRATDFEEELLGFRSATYTAEDGIQASTAGVVWVAGVGGFRVDPPSPDR